MSAPPPSTPDEAGRDEAARRRSLATLRARAGAWRAVPPPAFPAWLEEFVAATLAHARQYRDGAAFGPLLGLLEAVRHAPAYAAAVPDATWARLADALGGTPAAGPVRDARTAGAGARAGVAVRSGRPAPVGRVRAVGAPPPSAAPARARPVPPPEPPPSDPWQPPTL